MTSITRTEIALVIFLVIVVLIPFGIVILLGSPAPSYPTSGEPIRDLLDAEGISIMSVKESQWNMPGATGGKTYVIIDKDNKQTVISTQNFESGAARDAAIRSWHASGAGRAKPTGSLFIIGQHLVVISPSDRPVLETLGTTLNGYRY